MKNNNIPIFKFPSIIAAIMLFVAIGKLPYGYYQLLRFIVCGTAIYNSLIYFQKTKSFRNLLCRYTFWSFQMIFIALLFNPIIPFHFPKDWWINIDIWFGVVFLVNLFFLKSKSKNKNTLLNS